MFECGAGSIAQAAAFVNSLIPDGARSSRVVVYCLFARLLQRPLLPRGTCGSFRHPAVIVVAAISSSIGVGIVAFGCELVIGGCLQSLKWRFATS